MSISIAAPRSATIIPRTSTSPKPAIDVKISIHDQDIITPSFQGIGVELDPFGFMSENKDKGFNNEDWIIISDRIKNAGFDIARLWYQPDWHEPDNDDPDPNHINWDGFVFESERMSSVYKYLDLCESIGCKVNLVFGWKRDKSHYSWLCFSEGVQPMQSAPNDLDEWAESCSALLQYLFNVKKYTCIEYLTSFNEPNSNDDFEVPAGYDEKDWYRQMYKKIDERLIRDGIRHKIKLVAPDEAHDSLWLDYALLNMDEIIDVYAGHFHTNNAVELASFCDVWMNKILNANPGKFTKPFYLSEFGGIRDAKLRDSYEHGLILADLVITALNHGVTAMTRWCLSDIYLVSPIAGSHVPGDLIDHGLQKQGLWAYRDTGWMPRYSYYAYSLITRYTNSGAAILNVISTHSDICVSALKSSGGKYSILVLNKGNLDVNINVNFDSDINTSLKRHVYDSSVEPSIDATIILSSATIEVSSGFSDLITAKSLVVYEQSSDR